MASVRICAVSFRLGVIHSFADFGDHVSRLVAEAMAESPDFRFSRVVHNGASDHLRRI